MELFPIPPFDHTWSGDFDIPKLIVAINLIEDLAKSSNFRWTPGPPSHKIAVRNLPYPLLDYLGALASRRGDCQCLEAWPRYMVSVLSCRFQCDLFGSVINARQVSFDMTFKDCIHSDPFYWLEDVLSFAIILERMGTV